MKLYIITVVFFQIKVRRIWMNKLEMIEWKPELEQNSPSNITPGKQILVEFLQARFRVKIIKSDCHCYQGMWILSASRYEERGKRVSSIPIIYTAQDNRK